MGWLAKRLGTEYPTDAQARENGRKAQAKKAAQTVKDNNKRGKGGK